MFETTITFKPRSEWRAGMTPAKLIDEMDRTVRVPGLVNVWVPPIRNRIDMLATGIKSPIGVKVSGADLGQLDKTAGRIAEVAKTITGVSSALAERLTGGRYIDVDIDRAAAGRFGLNIADVQAIVSGAIGGEAIGQTVEGLARYCRHLVARRGCSIPLGSLSPTALAPSIPRSRNYAPCHCGPKVKCGAHRNAMGRFPES